MFFSLENVTSSEATTNKLSAAESAARPVDISRLDIRVGKVLSVEKVALCFCYV